MPRDKEFQRKKKDARMPVRDSHAEERMDTRQSEQDFNLLRARDAPSSGTARSRRYETAAQQAADDTQPFKADVPQQADISIPEHLESRDMDHEPARAPETRNPLEPGTSAPEPRRRDFRYVDSRREDSDSGNSDIGHSTQGESSQTERCSRMHQHGNKYQQRFQEAAKAEEPKEKPPEAAEGEPKRPSKLEFTADELPPEAKDTKLTKARRKAERTAEKLEQAENRLPARRKLRMETSSDPDTGKAKKRLKFEKEVKSQRTHVKGPVPLRPVKAGANMAVGYAHKKIYQAENENVGIKAAHRTELVSESGLRMAYHRHKTAPYRRVAKLQQKSARANARLAYRQALQDNPELKKNLLARMWQKQKIKRQYAKAAREAKKAGKRAKDTAVTTEKIAASVVHAVKRHPVLCGIVILLLLVFFLITSLFSSFSNIGTGGLGSLAASTYLADDADINNAELIYTEWETDLQMQINRVESDRPGYDEYRYNIGPIEHDPYVLMGYLTSAYQDFTYAQIESVLRELFNGQYSLSFTEETEIRYRTETHVDPETGEETEEEVPYEWHILNVTLTSTPLENLVVSRMDADQKEICEILLQTKGNRQYVKNVFGTNWLPYVTSYYGYRVHPISGEKNYHTGEGDDKQFYTITTEAGNVFYLIIDGKRDDNNVYFLNGVTEADLMALAEKNEGTMSVIPAEDVCTCTDKCEAGEVNTACPVCKNDLKGCTGKERPAETEEPAQTEPPKKDNGSAGTIIFIIVALLAVGGVGYYVKIVRPKQQAEDDEDFEDDGYGEGFDPDEAYGEPEYLSEDDFDDRINKEQEDSE